MDQAAWPVTTVTLEAGDRLLLYTDGLVERRNADLDEGVARLLQAVQDGRAGRTAEEGCDDILAVLQADLSDDVALLVCDYAGPVEGRAAVTITLPSDLSAIGDARAFVTATLECWGLVRLRDTVALLTSELVTNALVHTDGPVTLELRRDGGTVRLRVTDADTRPPRVHDGAGPDLEADGGRGMILVAGAVLRVGHRAVRLGQDRLGGRGPRDLSGPAESLSSSRVPTAVSPGAPRRRPGRPRLPPGRGH